MQQITFRLKEEDFERFKRRAEKEERSYASLSRFLVLNNLNKEEGSSQNE